VTAYANLLGRKADAKLLETTLKEEVATDKKLTSASKTLNLKPTPASSTKKAERKS
jgi:ferritin-like metal-binding protein YciE